MQAMDDDKSTFGFCTEFLLRDSDLAVNEVKARMERLGESVIAVGDANLLRVHVHTLRPGQALEFAVDHGTLAKVKIENMQLQHEAFVASGTDVGASDADRQQASSIGVIAVAANVTDCCTVLFQHLMQVFHHVLAALFGEGRHWDADDLAIVHGI